MARPACAYVDLAPTISKVIGDSKTITLVEVASVDQQQRTLAVKELKVFKGQPGDTPLIHQIAPGATALIARPILQWAQPGAQAVVFSSSRTAIVCMGTAWYQIKKTGDQWKLGPDRPELGAGILWIGGAPRGRHGEDDGRRRCRADGAAPCGGSQRQL